MHANGGRRLGGLVPLLLVPMLLVACGTEEESPTASDATSSESTSGSAGEESSVPPGARECADVWREGARLQRVYRGCVDNGEYVKAEATSCSSGQRMVRYADSYYAVLGGTIHHVSGTLEQDRDYRAAIRSCTA
jgi:hypothetical protein